jgi:CubicO group peptidase (beta-lactamase class C family)
VKDSLAPSTTVADGVRYGFKWWLVRHSGDKWAFAGSGFGGQRPIVVPEHDLVMVFTGWNIPGGEPSLTARAAIERVLAAVAAPKGSKR